jgi:hypothetical protein
MKKFTTHSLDLLALIQNQIIAVVFFEDDSYEKKTLLIGNDFEINEGCETELILVNAENLFKFSDSSPGSGFNPIFDDQIVLSCHKIGHQLVEIHANHFTLMVSEHLVNVFR